MFVLNIDHLAVAMVKKNMFDVYFDSKDYSEQLFHSMSVPNMARLAVAKVVARVTIFVNCILT